MFYDAYLTLLRKKSALIFCPVLYMMLALPAPLNTYGQHAAAIDSMKTEIRKYPDDPELLAMLAEQYEMISTDSAAYYGRLLLAQSAGDDQYTAKACQLLSNISLLKNDLDSAVFFLKKGIAAVKQGGLEYETALYTQALGQLYLNKGDIKEAVPEFNVGLNYFLNHHDAEKRDERLVFIYGGLGDCYTQSGLYALAIKYLQLALQHAEKLNDPVSKAINYNSILAVYQNMKDYEKSIYYGELSLKEFDKADYPLGSATVLLNMATGYHLLGNADQALQLLDTAEKIIISLNTTYNLGEVYTLYGDIYRKQKDYNKSTEYLNRAIRIHEQSGAKLYWGTALATLAQNQFDEGKKEQAQQTAIEALHLFNEIDVPKEKSELLYFLIRSNIRQGSAADSYLDQYMKTQSRYLNEEKVKAVTAQEIKYETTLKEARIARQQAELETGSQQRHYMLIGGSLALAAAAGLGLQYRRTSKQKELIQKQKQEILHNNRNSIQQLISIFGRQAHTEAEQALALAN